MFKQLLQAKAIDFCQIDSCRLGGVNENLAVMLMAAKFTNVPVCPHAGGVGLCDIQHRRCSISSRSDDDERPGDRYADYLHEHFEDPAVGAAAATRRRRARSITIRESSRIAHRYPQGQVWA